MNIGKNMITGYLKLFAKHILKVPWTNITINVIIKKIIVSNYQYTLQKTFYMLCGFVTTHAPFKFLTTWCTPQVTMMCVDYSRYVLFLCLHSLIK